MSYPASPPPEPAGAALPVLERLAALGVTRGAAVLVAVSGGADSVVLLHLLRQAAAPLGLRLSAAHFDHAMRPGSAADAAWVRGLCAAWSVPLHEARAAAPLRGEAEAREARYAFLRRIQRQIGADFLATAHHADDQVETVLFRMARGTGLRGLAGIPERGPGGLVRPLLPFTRAELRAYARACGLRWRDDPTNATAGPARNRIRHQLLPALEAHDPAVRARLLHLSALAAELEARLEARAARVLRRIGREEDGAVLLERGPLRAYDSPTAARVLRRVLRRFGTVPDRTGTRTALQFISSAGSGSALTLPGGRARILIEFDRARVAPAATAIPADEPLRVEGASGEGTAAIGGRPVRVRWRTGGEPAPGELAVGAERAPLTVRAWQPGDRIRTAGGTRTLKRLFNQARVPRTRRHQVPVVCDARGKVVWVVGMAREAGPGMAGPALILSITDA